MERFKTAVIGIGATGSVMAAALLSKDPEVILVGRKPSLKDAVLKNGLEVTGKLTYHVPVRHFLTHVKGLADFNPNLIFIATKTYHVQNVVDELQGVVRPGTKIVCTQNGLGPEDPVIEKFGKEATFRMTQVIGASVKEPGKVAVAAVSLPHYLGCFAEKNKPLGLEIATLLSDGGYTTEFVDDVYHNIWKKMVEKCSLGPVTALTGKINKEAMHFQPTFEIVKGAMAEILLVAKAMGYDQKTDADEFALKVKERGSLHRDSMYQDFLNKSVTEIDCLGAKIMEYAKAKDIPVPYLTALTNIVRGLQDTYLTNK